ncbi:MAG: hypothetical protein GX168_11305 [Bacteroidales bacterium]|nr:hypothetical protein [Bacteroidales bacterium]
MKIKHIVLIILLSGLAAGPATGQKAILRDRHQKGNIASFTDRIYEAFPEGTGWKKGDLKLTYVSRLDEHGNKLHDQMTHADGRPGNRYVYDINAQNQRARLTLTDGQGKMVRWIEYYYNGHGQLIEDQSYSPDSIPEKRFIYIYDDLGRVIEDYTFLGDGTLNMRFTYTYDEAGNPATNRRYSREGQLLKTVEYTFNAQGYMATQTERDADGKALKSLRFTYDWDATGNWTRKVTFEEGNPAELVEREIQYRP